MVVSQGNTSTKVEVKRIPMRRRDQFASLAAKIACNRIHSKLLKHNYHDRKLFVFFFQKKKEKQE